VAPSSLRSSAYADRFPLGSHSTAASATTPTTANTPPGHTAKRLKPLDKLRPWDVYTATPGGNDTRHIAVLALETVEC
jgi:hypothetical protein